MEFDNFCKNLKFCGHEFQLDCFWARAMYSTQFIFIFRYKKMLLSRLNPRISEEIVICLQ
jgi:hypothetical protein